MTIRPATHRASGLARREALLEAAVDLVAERGVAGVTHRGVAERAGLPASSTSYFFASIDDLVAEALREFAGRSIAAQHALGAAFADQAIDGDEFVDRLATLLASIPTRDQVAQIEAYVEASRRPEAAAEVRAVMDAFRATAVAALRAAGVRDPESAAPAFHALADGFMLHRVARPRARGHQAALRDGISALLAGFR